MNKNTSLKLVKKSRLLEIRGVWSKKIYLLPVILKNLICPELKLEKLI